MRLAGLALFLALLAAGCGGAGGGGVSSGGDGTLPGAGRGRVAVRVAWPGREAGRVIPVASQAIRVEVRSGGSTLASALVVSPGAGAVLDEIPVGSVSVRATAYATPAGTGVALATAEVSASVAAGTTSTVPVTLTSTVQSLSVAPSSVTLLLSILSHATLVPTARNSGGVVVPVAAGDWQFTSAQPLIAVVSSVGTVTGLLPGSTTITVRERTSGRTIAVPVTVIA